jgi:TIR domain/Clp amino terminal domain, pathogenicity island component
MAAAMPTSDEQVVPNQRFQWERYTERARLVVRLAQEEARGLGYEHIDSEHVLLGLLREQEGVAAQVLEGLEVGPNRVRREIQEGPKSGHNLGPENLPYTERVEMVFESALRLSLEHKVNYIGTEHLLLGLLEGDGEVGRILRKLGSAPETVRARTLAKTARLPRARIFLCHSSADKPAIRELFHKLRQEGLAPWFDEENLLPGEDWDLAIRRAVRNADCVAVCLSRTSTTSAGYVHREIKEALDVADEQPEGTIFVIPVRLEECDVPDRLRHLHWVDLFADGGYRRLLRAFGP